MVLGGEVRICGDRFGTRTSLSSIRMSSVSPLFCRSIPYSPSNLAGLVLVGSDKSEPHYSRPPKVDPYAAIKQQKKYIL